MNGRTIPRVSICGWCANAPASIEGVAAHHRCPGNCLCADHQHLPDPAVVDAQARYTKLDPAAVLKRWRADLAHEGAST